MWEQKNEEVEYENRESSIAVDDIWNEGKLEIDKWDQGQLSFTRIDRSLDIPTSKNTGESTLEIEVGLDEGELRMEVEWGKLGKGVLSKCRSCASVDTFDGKMKRPFELAMEVDRSLIQKNPRTFRD